MSDKNRHSQFQRFAALHVPGDPLVLYNIWDVGSAQAVVRAGAKAIATGSHPVADASGFADGEGVPMEFAFANAERIVDSVDLPVTIDFEGGYAVEPEAAGRNVARLAETGAVGCNFEDQVIGGAGLHPLDLQCLWIEAIRAATGPDFFINARTDLFLKTDDHSESLVDEVIERGKAFADSGASGFFVPRLSDSHQIERVVREVRLPLNVIAFPGAPPKSEWASAGVARISHGPFPHRELMKHLEQMARAAIE